MRDVRLTAVQGKSQLSEFKLSCTMTGHQHPVLQTFCMVSDTRLQVRDVAAASDDIIATAEVLQCHCITPFNPLLAGSRSSARVAATARQLLCKTRCSS